MLVMEMSAELSRGVDMSGYLMLELELDEPCDSSQFILGTLTLVGQLSSSLLCFVVGFGIFSSSSFLVMAIMMASLRVSSSFRCLSCVWILDIIEVIVSAWCWLKKLNLEEIVALCVSFKSLRFLSDERNSSEACLSWFLNCMPVLFISSCLVCSVTFSGL